MAVLPASSIVKSISPEHLPAYESDSRSPCVRSKTRFPLGGGLSTLASYGSQKCCPGAACRQIGLPVTSSGCGPVVQRIAPTENYSFVTKSSLNMAVDGLTFKVPREDRSVGS